MDFQDYQKWFTSVYGPEVTKKILDDKNECINSNKQELKRFFESYARIEPISDEVNGYTIKGCNECISKGLLVRKQDTPGFLGKLNEIKYVIIGLEVNIRRKSIPKDGIYDIHIAFDPLQIVEEKEHQLFANLKKFFRQIKEKAYITDIAKCRSTKLNESRQICLTTHFFKELEILLDFNPKLQIILQGTSVQSFFSDKLTQFSTHESDDEIKSKKGKYEKLLFKRQYLSFNDREIPTVVFPHAASRTSVLWKEINEPEVTDKINTKLREFKFD